MVFSQTKTCDKEVNSNSNRLKMCSMTAALQSTRHNEERKYIFQ